MAKNLFKEKQSHRGKDLIILITILMAATAFGLGKELLSNDTNMLQVVVALAIILALAFGVHLLLKARIRTSISKKRIAVGYSFWYSKKHKINLEEVESCAVVKTPKANQWHGDNIGYSNENFFSFSGRNGIRLRTKDGRKYFIGTNKVDEMEHAIKKALG